LVRRAELSDAKDHKDHGAKDKDNI